MGRVIQMIVTSDDNSLFITGFDNTTKMLSFRVSREPIYLQTEEIHIVKDIVSTNLYFFKMIYLNKFIIENTK